jgi:acetoacetate decarboxylase
MSEQHDVLGRTVTMPVGVRDATAATVMYDIGIDAARALAPPGFHVVESAPGKAQLAIALVDYRDNDLGSYHEVGTIFFVRPAGGGPDGTFITHLPVDQEFTCAAGNQIWGFPKSVEQIG